MTAEEVAERAINTPRRTLLDWYERQIEAASGALSLVFKKLRDEKSKPYLLTHASFEDYCADRWNMTRRRVQQMMAGESLRVLLLEQAPEMAPRIDAMKERAIREIVTTPPEKRIEVLREAVRTPGRVTAAKIKQAKARVIGTVVDGAPPAGPVCCSKCGQILGSGAYPSPL